MITEVGAVKVRGGEVLGEFQTLVNPHQLDPAVHRGADRHHRLDGRRGAADRPGAPPVPRVRPGLRPGRAQRPLRRRFPEVLRRAPGPALAGVRGARHRAAGAPGDHPRRRAQLQAELAGDAVRRHDDTQPPGALRRPRDGRRAARADGSARQPGRAHARGAPDVLRPGEHGPATQAPPGRGSPPRPRRLPLPRRPAAGALRRHVQGPAHPGPQLLHRLGDALPDGRDGQPGLVRPGHRVRHPARGGGARAAADRRAQAALQPAFAVPRAGALDQAHRRAVAAALPGAPGARRRRRLRRAVRLQAHRRAQRRRAARGLPDPPVRRPDAQAPLAERLRPGRDGALPVSVQPGRLPRALRRRGGGPPDVPRRRDRTRWWRPCPRG